MRSGLRLSVRDLVVLVVALAAGLAVNRHLPAFLSYQATQNFVQQYSEPTSRNSGFSSLGWSDPSRLVISPTGRPFHQRPSYWLLHLPYWSGPCLIAATLALVGASLIDLRTAGRQVLRQPGGIAGIMALLAFLLLATDWTRYHLTLSTRSIWTSSQIIASMGFSWFHLPRLAGFAVGVAWLTLGLSGGWAVAGTGREPLRRVVGGLWIVAGLACQLGIWCHGLNL